jgi:hypothetical protein
MPDPKQFLYERGLADRPPDATPDRMWFPFRMQDGELIPAEGVPVSDPRAVLPDDYAARVLALEYSTRVFADEGLDPIKVATRWFHSFLTNSEPQVESIEQTTFTDK